MAKFLQSPIILPPESISKNTITQEAFSLERAFAVTFQISSSNLKLIATELTDENGEIITEYTSEPDTDKELGFSIFLTDDVDAHTFGASAGRCGWIDYSTKGEVAEGVSDNGDKVIIDFEDNSTNSDLDLLLDHVYPENINNLVKNQTPEVKSIFSMLFLSNKTFFDAVTDIYGNLYYDSLIVDANGNVTDFLTGELKPISEYTAPVIIQYSIGKDIHYTVYDFIFEDNPIDILNINYYTFRLLFENYGGILTLEIMKPGETFYRPCMTKELPHNYYGNHNIRFGFGQFTPLFSYDIDKKANFNIHNIQLQQSDERPDWLKTLDKELKNLLDMETFNTELLGAENKLILHTDRISDEKSLMVDTLLEKVIPANIEVMRYNHNIEVSWRDLNKYAECVTNADIAEVNPDWKNDLTSDGEWVYPLTKYIPKMLLGDSGLFSFGGAATVSNLYFYTEASTKGDFGGIYLCADNKNLKKVVIEQPNLADIRYNFKNCTNLEEAYIYMPENKAANVYNAFNNCPALKKLHLVLPSGVSYDHGGEAENASNLCLSSKIDAESASRLLNSLPVRNSYKMGLGIHADLQNDEEVLAAIANAEAKGWILTVRWNGKPTSTASVMRFGQLIYARVGEMELPDGTTEKVLDWGHYVTDPTGYETFRSIESAYEYFGLEQEALTLN